MAPGVANALAGLLMASFAGALQLSSTVSKSHETIAIGREADYGDDACACVGIDGLTGSTNITIGGAVYASLYPTEIGSSCEAWDAGRYPGDCTGAIPADWCAKKWCYVDPCACNIGTNPSRSTYLAGATYEGKQIFYSYATCGATNTYNTPPSVAQVEECSKTWDATTYGTEACPCVGIDGLTGTTDVMIGGLQSDLYPAEIGSSCEAWDAGRYPGSCDGASPADWCSQKWCYVDTTNCVVSSGPFASGYLPEGKFQGKGLFYSYVTCQGVNTYDTPSASGDPHLINTRGEKFDIYRSGIFEFVRAPREATQAEAGLTVHANVTGMHGEAVDCSMSLYIRGLSFGGAWLGSNSVNLSFPGSELLVRVGGKIQAPSKDALHLGVSPVGEVALLLPSEGDIQLLVGSTTFRINQGGDVLFGHKAPFMNMKIKGQHKLGCALGGLLGEDSHVEAATRPPRCREQMLLASSAHPDGFHGSVSMEP